MLLATCCEDEIVPHVLPFVTSNIQLSEWNKRDAAIMAFGRCSLCVIACFIASCQNVLMVVLSRNDFL